MFQHIVLFKFFEGTTDEQSAALTEGLSSLPGTIDAIKRYRCGTDIGIREGTWDFGVTAEFDDEAGWRAYQEHPDHKEVVVSCVNPIVAERASVQFMWPA